MATTKKTKTTTERVMVCRRLPRQLWTSVQDHVTTVLPRTTDTAILELALAEYLERNASKQTGTGPQIR
jgi:hypothetical protein